jgi:hypothetical protein
MRERDLELALDLAAKGERWLLDPYSDDATRFAADEPVRLARHGVRMLQARSR